MHVPGSALGDNRLVSVGKDSVRAVAALLVSAGRVVPALGPDSVSGRYRSWWWPLPTASQRHMVASLLEDASPDAQAEVAAALAGEVDALVRQQLVVAGATHRVAPVGPADRARGVGPVAGVDRSVVPRLAGPSQA